MNVQQLNADQLQQLRQVMLYEVHNLTHIADADDISDEEVCNYFANVEFVEDDFFHELNK